MKSIFACLIWGFTLFATQTVLADETCFGGVGQRCGGWSPGGLRISSCQPSPDVNPSGVCMVSNGSWTHDQCCFANPNGVQCGGNGSSSACGVEMDRSIHRFVYGYNWTRNVDYRVVNNSGVVDRPRYCARPLARVHRLDAARCCSGEGATPAPLWQRFGRPSLAVCR